MRSAARLFLTRSYQSVGVDELCAVADVRKGSFYHYFPAKSDLAKAVVDHHAAALWAHLDRAALSDRPGARLHAMADAVGEIQAAFEARFGHVVGCPFGNLAAELATTDDGLREHLAAVFAEWERRLAVLCQAGADPARLARILVAQFQGMILLAKTGRSAASEIPDALHHVIALNLREVP